MWPFWLLCRLAGGPIGTVLIVIGSFGPMLAAGIVIRSTGSSLMEWLRTIIRWRCHFTTTPMLSACLW